MATDECHRNCGNCGIQSQRSMWNRKTLAQNEYHINIYKYHIYIYIYIHHKNCAPKLQQSAQLVERFISNG